MPNKTIDFAAWMGTIQTRMETALQRFLPAPEIVPGFMQSEIEAVFHSWNPLYWHVIKARRVFVSDTAEID